MFRTGDPLNEYCFKFVDSGAPNIEEDCQAEAEITEGTCPLREDDINNGIARQRNISEIDEEDNMRAMLLREFPNSQKRLVLTNPSRHWPNNRIPYLLR